MPESALKACVVLTSCAMHEEAAQLAHTLVEEHLAACATLVPGTESVYRWNGAVETATETLLLLKTTPVHIPVLETRLRALHSYQTPEFLVLPVERCSRDYLEWLHASLQPVENDE